MKKTATVAYEDPKAVGALARYEKKVEYALQAMGATKPTELLAGSQAFVLGQFRAAVEPKHAASVIWHKHCEAGLTAPVPCVAREETVKEETGAACPHDPPAEAPKIVAVVAAEEARRELKPILYDRVDLGLAMHHWHSGQFDPIYMVGSFYVENKVYPDKTIVEEALDEAERLLGLTTYKGYKKARKYTGIEYEELRSIVASLKVRLAKDYGASEAHDGGLACQPFTRLERDPTKLAACKARAAGPLDSDEKMFRFLRDEMNAQDQEVFVVVGLDLHKNLRSYTEVARGQRDRVAVAVEDILRVVIADGPHGFCVAHNHPSGNARPSAKDKELTAKIESAALTACPNVVFLDHLVVGTDNWYSFRDGKQKHASV